MATVDHRAGRRWQRGVLVVAHAIADGRSLLAAVTEAVCDSGRTPRYPADHYSRPRLLFTDIAAAVPRLSAAALAEATGHVVAFRSLLSDRRGAPHPHAAPALVAPTRLATVNRITICVPAPQWNALAAARGGTPTTLAVATVAGVAANPGRVDSDGLVRMFLPVSLRTAANDHMANALTMVNLPVGANPDTALDLAKLRGAMKQVLESSGRPSAHDRRLWRILPQFHELAGCGSWPQRLLHSTTMSPPTAR